MKQIILGKYRFSCDKDIVHETYHCKWYSGVIFYIHNKKYDIVNNPHFGYRIIITSSPYHCMGDIPFKKETYRFLPEEISVEEI